MPEELSALQTCPRCGTVLEVMTFPAFYRATPTGKAGEPVVVDGESACFYHPRKRAHVPCDGCGRFLCELCDMQLHGQHLCPPCLESGKKNKKIVALEDSRMLYGQQALVLSLLPLCITGLAAIFMALRYWKTPESLVAPSRATKPAALIFGSLQTLAFAALFLYLYTH